MWTPLTHYEPQSRDPRYNARKWTILRDGREFLSLFPSARVPPVAKEPIRRGGLARTWGELLETPVLLPEPRVSTTEVGRRLAAAQTPSATMGGPTGGVQGGAQLW